MRVAVDSKRELEIDSDAFVDQVGALSNDGSWINFTVYSDGHLAISNQGDAEAVFSPAETPDVLLAIQAWIERLT